MANQTSVLDINVNYQEFLEYLDAVREYRELLDKSGKDLAKAVALPKDSVSEREKASKNDATSSKELVTISHSLTSAEAATNKERKEGNRQLEERKRLREEEGRVQKENIKRARSFASSPLGKIGIGALSTAFSIKGAMKVFGALQNISQTGLVIRARTLRTGMDAGHIKAWENNLQPYDPEGAMMDTAIEATRDAGTAAKLRGIGVDTSSGDANKILASMIPALREFEHTHKGQNEDAIWAGRHLEQLQGAALSLERAGEKETQAIPGQVERDAAPDHGGISGKTLKDQQDAALASGRLHNDWEAKKLTTTAPLAEKMANEEEKAQEKLDDLATAAENAAIKLSQMTGGYSTLFLGIATALSPLLGGLGIKGGKGLLSFLAGNAGKATGIGLRALSPLSAFLALGGDTPQKQPEFKEWDDLVAHYKKRTGASSSWGMNQNEERRLVQQETHKGTARISPHQQRENPIAPPNASLQPHLSRSNTSPSVPPQNAASPTIANAGIPDFDRLTGAVAMAESGGDPHAHSNRGAMGLMQLMPATARGAHVKDPYDAHQSWEAGEKILKQLSQHYHGDMEKTLAAYNWGQGNLDKDISRRGANWKQELPRETANYIPRVLQNLARGTVVKIENYSGQNVAISARQATIL